MLDFNREQLPTSLLPAFYPLFTPTGYYKKAVRTLRAHRLNVIYSILLSTSLKKASLTFSKSALS